MVSVHCNGGGVGHEQAVQSGQGRRGRVRTHPGGGPKPSSSYQTHRYEPGAPPPWQGTSLSLSSAKSLYTEYTLDKLNLDTRGYISEAKICMFYLFIARSIGYWPRTVS